MNDVQRDDSMTRLSHHVEIKDGTELWDHNNELLGDTIMKSDISDTELDCLSGLLTKKPDDVRRAVLLKGTPFKP